jgi:hypothetical protein
MGAFLLDVQTSSDARASKRRFPAVGTAAGRRMIFLFLAFWIALIVSPVCLADF